MRKIKYKIIFLVGLLTMIMSITTVFAAFIYTQNVSVNTTVGKVYNISKSFYNYCNNVSATSEKEARIRKDTVLVIDGIQLNSSHEYNMISASGQTFEQGVTYYIRENNEFKAATVTIGAAIQQYTYYTRTTTYGKIASIKDTYDASLNEVPPTISTSAFTVSCSYTVNETAINETLTYVVDTANGVISSCTSSVENHVVVIGSDGLSMVVLDSTKTTSEYTTVSADTAITCSASKGRFDSSNIYLSQLGLHFEFTTEIAVYVRIHIQDAWKRTRVYSASSQEAYIMKDQINGVSPFNVSDENWYYDADTNYIYLKQMFVPTKDAQDNYIPMSTTFNVNAAYFYQPTISTAFTEYVDVQVSFSLDIVQANRAYALWKIDPETIGE